MAAAIAGDADALDEICDPGFVNHAAPNRAGGLQGLKDVLAFSRRTQPDQVLTEQYLVADDDMVVLYGVREGTWQASAFRGIPTPTGQRVAVEMAHMFRITAGMITEHWAVRDDLGMMFQLGALTPQ